jgi:hypothetical protein
MLELSTVAVDILVDQRAITASNMLVRRTSIIRAVNAESSKLDFSEGLPVGLDAWAGPNPYATTRQRSARERVSGGETDCSA